MLQQKDNMPEGMAWGNYFPAVINHTSSAKQNSIYHANPTSWVEESPALPADSPVKLSSDPDLYTSAATNDEDNFCKINYAFSH